MVNSNTTNDATSIINFTQIPFKFGDCLQLEDVDNHECYTIQLIGFLQGFSLLVTSPASTGSLIRDNQRVVIRYFSGQHAYAFTSHIVQLCYQPYPYMHLSVPKSVKLAQARQTSRIKTKLPAQLYLQQYAPISCLITDLSMDGLSIESSFEHAKQGNYVQISFDIPLLHTISNITVDGEIRSVSKINLSNSLQADNIHCGIAFNSLPPEIAGKIQHFIYQSLDAYRWLEPPALAFSV